MVIALALIVFGRPRFFALTGLPSDSEAAAFGLPRETLRNTRCSSGIAQPIVVACSLALSKSNFNFFAIFANGTVCLPLGSR